MRDVFLGLGDDVTRARQKVAFLHVDELLEREHLGVDAPLGGQRVNHVQHAANTSVVNTTTSRQLDQ